MQVQTVLYVKGNGFKWVLNELDMTVWTELMWFGTGRTSSIFHSFLYIRFSKAVPCTASWLSHFSLHILIILDTWTKAVASLKDSAGMLYLSLILEWSRRVQVGNNSSLHLGQEQQNKTQKYGLLGCDNCNVWIWNLDPYKFWWQFVTDFWKENTAKDLWANPRGL